MLNEDIWRRQIVFVDLILWLVIYFFTASLGYFGDGQRKEEKQSNRNIIFTQNIVSEGQMLQKLTKYVNFRTFVVCRINALLSSNPPDCQEGAGRGGNQSWQYQDFLELLEHPPLPLDLCKHDTNGNNYDDDVIDDDDDVRWWWRWKRESCIPFCANSSEMLRLSDKTIIGWTWIILMIVNNYHLNNDDDLP